MTTAPDIMKPKRRWFQFSLRALLLGMLAVGCGLGWLARERNEVRKRADAIEAIEKLGGSIEFDGETPFRPPWLRPLVGDNSPGEIVEVSLTNTPVTDAGLAHLAGMTKLKRLWLLNTRVSDAGLAHLARLTKLERLWLDNTLVTDAGLAHLGRLTNLNLLWLGNTPVTDAGLAQFAGLTKLEFLSLGDTQVTDAGLADLQRILPNARVIR